MWNGSLRSRLHEDAPKSTNRYGTLPGSAVVLADGVGTIQSYQYNAQNLV
jgi:hypothetical protein